MTTKRETNQQFVARLMKGGPMVEVMIIEAVAKYADAASVNRLPEDSIVNPDAWQKTAKGIKAACDERFK